ncbi:hypothetical protein LR69_02643 [Geobacillus sp. BCO2]|nr:hypothetical protein LR69_02643 [Geobacillus sp. BCO2]
MNPEPSKLYTYADYIQWDGRWELIDGKAYNMSLHQRGSISLPLWNYRSHFVRTFKIKIATLPLLRLMFVSPKTMTTHMQNMSFNPIFLSFAIETT